MTGAVGLPGIIADLSASTLDIFSLLADIAGSHGYESTIADIQAACIDAFIRARKVVAPRRNNSAEIEGDNCFIHSKDL
jgi:hypothetical protein